MLRKTTRRTFTVETKQGLHQGRAIITAKAPRTPRKGTESAQTPPSPSDLWGAMSTAPTETLKGEEPRRILPNLTPWEPSEPETVPFLPSEPSLPRVRRIEPPVVVETPRRRGRPRKVTIEVVDVAPVVPVSALPAPAPVAASPSPSRPVRIDRSGTAGLARGERWKRRLPRACW